MAKKPYHHGDLGPALLDAVKELVAEKGIESLSLRECARRAGVSWSAPGHHFGDKTGMLTAFAIKGFGELKAHMERRRDEAVRPSERSAAVGMGYLEFALRNPEYFRVMFRAELLNEKDPKYQAANAAAFGVLEQSIRECRQTLGVGGDAMLPQICLLAWSSVHGFASLVLEGAIPQLARSKKSRQTAGMELGRELILLLGPSLFGPVRA
ncbi:MAG TPA: TetR/AcrR family transcriptional regulator [Bryobacteraceae bacterium]|nr:TetR/AcrR family transcriptional regulator [Bryobacteraceae bacterium]